MKISLVNMPWQALDYPSLACGILQTVISKLRPNDEVLEYHGNIKWAEYLLEITSGDITPIEYNIISDNTFYYGAGDWVFGIAEKDRTSCGKDYIGYLTDIGVSNDIIRLVINLRKLSNEFVERSSREILSTKPDVVGFSTTFMQNAASLQVAKRIKEISSGTTIVFGGGNCDDQQGLALHRNFPFIDFVVRGEGEETFPQLLDAIESGNGFEQIMGLCWRNREKQIVHNEQSKHPVPIWKVPEPIYDSYFEMINQSPIRGYIEPKLTFEGARGCWWGEKSQCTFCGLNGSSMAFRSKDPELLVSTIESAVKKYQTLDVIMVDNIIDTKFFSTLLPKLRDDDWDLRMHYEVKSNLSEEQVSMLKDAKVFHIQPGIESLNTRVLKLMKKGVTGTQNIKLLRWCEESNLDVSWNYLYGFPGEEQTDYDDIISQISSLHHLHPPAGATRIALERFSPYFEDSSLGLTNLGAAKFYRYLYELSDNELAEMAYLFDATRQGIDEQVALRLKRELEKWIKNYPTSTLEYFALPGGQLLIEDRRMPNQKEYIIENPILARAYIELFNGLTISSLSKKLISQFGHQEACLEDFLSSWINSQVNLGLVFRDRERFTSLATKPNAQRIRIVG
ncbi:RiPP maturation radical SAM C-methyltransferase [Alicyclobacillus ferrooxydans]|uniref:B12-binding domain-containing protein n=1 Tax=Alicyclobacillus ferrooxydans TaxID=471514 RepID=A0A0P9D8P7_9BACL|nr:RiPP maturation radical SAM C-methyltransferase [Alicyclobacillus ferrooxydans]KPV45753.1 hypothetical protein AN477_01575 [Alicyclobacillus ferrooxydans]